jgi:hypothetical protein
MMIIAYQMVPPPGLSGYGFPEYSTLILVPGAFGMLACWGYRGMVSGHVRKTASAVLFFTNAIPFLLYTAVVLLQWWNYR